MNATASQPTAYYRLYLSFREEVSALLVSLGRAPLAGEECDRMDIWQAWEDGADANAIVVKLAYLAACQRADRNA